MSADERDLPEDLSVSWLAAYDEALAHGGAPSLADAANVPPEWRPRLHRALACLERLERLWPRHGGEMLPAAAATAHCPVCGHVNDSVPRAASCAAETPPSVHPTLAAAPDQPAQAPVVRIPGYEVLAELGRGGMGVVYKARQLSLKRLVALKMILAGPYAGSRELARFRVEAEAAAQLQHPNIVQIHEVGARDGLPYFSMELIEGGSLAQKIAGTPQPPRQAAALVETLAEAIDYAHQHGIIHRDLKPANVLLAISGQPSAISGEEKDMASGLIAERCLLNAVPKIADFGLAKRMEGTANQTKSGAILGTPSYAAPEQAAGRLEEVGPAADIYALGAILYEMLTGRPPFQGETPLETLLQVRTAEPVPPSRLQPKIPRDLETICLKCLRKEPGKRYARARDLAEDLRRFRAGETIRARPVGACERGVKWARRRPALAGLLAVTGLAILALLAGGWWHTRQLDGALRQAEERGTEAERQHQQAVGKFKMARRAVDEMLTQVGQTELANLPGVDQVRQQLLQKALAFYQEFLAESRADPALRQETGWAYRQVADIYHTLGQQSEEDDAYRQALTIQKALADEFPNRPDYRQDMARTHSALAFVLKSTVGRLPEAMAAYRQVLAIQKQLADEFPNQPDYRLDLSTSLNSWGVLLGKTGELVEAEKAFHQAMRIQEQLAAEFPTQPQYREALALSHRNLANVLQLSDRLPEAERVCREVLQLRAQLVDQFSSQPSHRLNLADDFNSLGAILEKRENRAEAASTYRQARQLYANLAAEFPEHPVYPCRLGGVLYHLTRMPCDCAELAETRQLLEKGIRLLQDALRASPTNLTRREGLFLQYCSLAETLLRLEKPVEAAQVAAEVPGVFPERAVDSYNAACYFARCVPLVEKDHTLPEPKRQELARAYGTRAVALLRQAFQKGYQDFAHLLKDPDLDPLRSNDDFKQLTASRKDEG